MRAFMPLVFFIMFIGWVLYRALIKKDLKQNMSSLYVGLCFIAVWATIYILWIR